MMVYEDFKARLKGLIQKTTPDRAGLWQRYLSAPDSKLDEYVASCCYSYLREDAPKRREIEDWMCDDDILWFVQVFIDKQTAAIKKPSDIEPMLLGVVAVAIIGPHSDPRDVSFWLGQLYLASTLASIPEKKQICERVGNIAADKWGVAEQIRLFPDRNERATARDIEIIRTGGLRIENPHDVNGMTPMMHAALEGNIPKLVDQIQKGADINAVSDGASAIAFAAFAGHERVVEFLLSLGARVNVSPHGMSLLEFANLGERKPVISELLKRAGATGPQSNELDTPTNT